MLAPMSSKHMILCVFSAYFSTCDGGKSDEWIERREFPALVR